MENRKPSVAGQFYPATKVELESELMQLFRAAVPKYYNNVLGIISPHAGYVFSGGVAASAFNQIDGKRKYDDIFVIASSHRTSFAGASVYNKGDFIMPSGNVKVDIALANKLVNDNEVFKFGVDAHNNEHSLEVQLPLLQFIMKTDFKIIPIIIGTQSPAVCKKIAEALMPYFNSKNLFIISTDFSHYPVYKDAVKTDSITADAIVSGSPQRLLDVLQSNENINISGLSTSLCGWTSVLTLLYMAESKKLDWVKVQYKNSGDSKYGDRNRVVGYNAILFKEKITNNELHLTINDKKELLTIARKSIVSYIRNGKRPDFKENDFSDNIKGKNGVFVTLHKKGELRGCIGRFKSDQPLYLTVRDMAIESSTEDTRFTPVNINETDNIDLEISVLTPMRKINNIDEIELGKHGIYIKKGYSGGTFLPQVATETGWTKEEFLGHCARDKAGIGWFGWKDEDAELFIYEAIVFDEKEVGLK